MTVLIPQHAGVVKRIFRKDEIDGGHAESVIGGTDAISAA
jgi:hypothetical protein